MALLYQQIMDVPGLSGSWKDRLKQYNKALTGKDYRGTLQEGLYMLKQIANQNFPQVKPAPTPAAQPQPSQTSAQSYAQPGVEAGQNADQASFQEALPFKEAWGRLSPQATNAAVSQINPEVQREFDSNYRNLMNNLTSSGGQRFGRGLAQGGELRASAERNRLGQVQDWLSQYQQGYKSLFYEPSQTNWNKAITSGVAPDQSSVEIPTWSDVYNTTNDANGYSGLGGSGSPFYG